MLTSYQIDVNWKPFSVFGLVSLTLSLCALFLILEKIPIILLYMFAAQHQTSKLRCQNYVWFCSKFNVQSDELSPSFQNLQEVVQNLRKPNSCWKMYIYIILGLRVKETIFSVHINFLTMISIRLFIVVKKGLIFMNVWMIGTNSMKLHYLKKMIFTVTLRYYNTNKDFIKILK